LYKKAGRVAHTEDPVQTIRSGANSKQKAYNWMDVPNPDRQENRQHDGAALPAVLSSASGLSLIPQGGGKIHHDS
jgi:hypothetical protein